MAEIKSRDEAIKIMEKALGDYNSTGNIKVQRGQLFQAFEVLKSQESQEDLVIKLENKIKEVSNGNPGAMIGWFQGKFDIIIGEYSNSGWINEGIEAKDESLVNVIKQAVEDKGILYL